MKNFTTIALVAAFTFIPSLAISSDQSAQAPKNLIAQKHARDLSYAQEQAIQSGLLIGAYSAISVLPYAYIGFLTRAKEVTPSTLKTVFKKSAALSTVAGVAAGVYYGHKSLKSWKQWNKPE